MPAHDRRRPLASQHGFSMVELLIGMSITLVVLATTLGALTDGLKMSDTAKLLTQMQHNARSGLNLVTRDLMQTGQGIPKGGITIPSGAGANLITRPGPGSLTYPAGTVVLPAVTTGQGLGGVVQGRVTDIISVIYADATLALNAAPLVAIAADGSAIDVDPGTDITDPGTGIQPGDFIMFSNAMGNAIQEATQVTSQTVAFASTDTMHFNQPGAPTGSIVGLQDGPGTYPPTTATRIWMVTYYVDDTDPASPRLMRIRNNQKPRPVALDVEDLQITYDLVDGYLNPAGVDEPLPPNAPAQIRKVNLTLMTRSHTAQRTTGAYQYQTLKTQVSLRSLSFIDRYQ